jgi:Transposase DDE domain
MPRRPQAATMSGIPKGCEKPVREDFRVNLVDTIKLLLEHLTPALCKAVFKKHRDNERERKWTLYAVATFWAAMIIRNPRGGMDAGWAQMRKGRGRDKLWPRVQASSRAFRKKLEALRPHLFQSVYEAFTASILPKAPPAYASWMNDLMKCFPELHIVDGSRLDAVCRGLGILRDVRARVLGGCMTVFYDLYRGISRQVLFFPDAAQAELPRALSALEWIAKGSLIMGDRLYASVQYFHLLNGLGLFGLFRKNGRLKIKRVEVLSSYRGSRTFWEDVLVEVGCGAGQPKIMLRLIRYRDRGHRLNLLTNVLDPKMLSVQQMVQLYGLRWNIERLFLDVKETLELSDLHSAHPNLIAQQVYATFLVHTAFRVAQARIAERAGILPEQLSPAKLFPKLAQAAHDYCVVQIRDDRIRQANPGVAIKFPSLRTMPFAELRLGAVLVRKRSPHRRRRRFCASAKRWKSIAHVPGGPTFLRHAVVS